MKYYIFYILIFTSVLFACVKKHLKPELEEGIINKKEYEQVTKSQFIKIADNITIIFA